MSIPRDTSRPRKSRRRTFSLSTLGALALSMVLAACADAPTGPSAPPAAPSAGLLGTLGTVTSTLTTTVTGTLTRVTALVRAEPIVAEETRSYTIRRSTGGTIEWPDVGLTVIVPARAFSAKEMTITVTALRGDVVAYEFGPHGVQFDRPLTIVQNLNGTGFWRLGVGARLQGAYFKSADQINEANDTALVDEFQPTTVDYFRSQVRFDVSHFSGYMVSTD